MRIKIFSLCLILSLAFAEFARAVEGDMEFAKRLYQEGDFHRAITEAKRYIFQNPDGVLNEEAMVFIADSYESHGEPKEAIAIYKRFLSDHPLSSLLPDVYFRLGRLYTDNRKYSEAVEYFENALRNAPDKSELRRKSIYWLFISKLLSGGAENIETSSLISTGNPADGITLESYKKKYEELQFKSPVVAGSLAAVFPGAGHLYINRSSDAFAAFLLNGLFIWGIVESLRKNDTGVGVTLFVFEFGWYSGNIYSAVNGAHKYNRHLNDSFKLQFAVDSDILSNNPTVNK